MKKKEWLIFLGLFLLALALRLIGLASREIQYDDAFSIFLARQNLPNIIRGTAADTMPPLYYFLLHYWQLISGSLTFLRLLSVALSLIGWLIAFDFSRRISGFRAAVVTGLLLAINPLQIYHSQDLRMYGLLLAGQLGYYWFFYRIFEEKKNSKISVLGLVLCGVIAMYSHALAVFGLIWANIYLILRKRWVEHFHLIKAQFIIGLIYLPWAFMLPEQIEKVQRAFWTPKPGIVEVLQSIILFHANLPLEGILLPLAAVFSAQVFVVMVWEVFKERRSSEVLLLLALCVFGLPALLFSLSYFVQPVFVTRVFILSATLYCVVAGRIIVTRWKRGIGGFLIGGFLLAALISLPTLYTYNEFPRSPFRQAVEYLNKSENRDIYVLHDNKLSFFPMYYYDPSQNTAFLADEPGSPNDTFAPASQEAMDIFPVNNLSDAVDHRQRFFFVVFSKAIAEYEESGLSHPVLQTLQQNYLLRNHLIFGDLEIYDFEVMP